MNPCARHAALWALPALLFGAAAWGSDELVLERGEHYRDLAPHVEYLEDPGGDLTLSDVVSGNAAGRFEPISGGRIDFGFSESTFWLRLQVRNGDDAAIDRRLSLNMRFMQELDMWLVHDDTTDSSPNRSCHGRSLRRVRPR